ncbi:MAG TPA: hypothetical protein PK208_12850 [Fibrobacteria bacterium]|nr:hypothetical protein [Fibrobacteria bacterium]
MRLLLVSLFATGAVFASEPDSVLVPPVVPDSSAKQAAPSLRLSETSPPARWGSAPKQFFYGVGGGLAGGFGGLVVGSIIGFIAGAADVTISCDGASNGCEEEKVGDAALVGGVVGMLVGAPVGAAAGVRSGAPEDFASEADFATFLGGIGGFLAGGLIGGIIEGESDVPGVGVLGALSGASLGAVVVDRLTADAPGTVPTMSMWSPNGKALGARVSWAF